jgi:hypothetical protein
MAPKPQNSPRLEGESLRQYRARLKEERLADERRRVEEYWGTNGNATAQTREHAHRTQQGAIARMFEAGHINGDELEWAAEIAEVADLIMRDVSLASASWETRVDCNGTSKDKLLEGVRRVRLEMAYGWWRDRISEPKTAILAMLTGETEAYSTVAARHRMGKKRARKLLISAIDLWPEAVEWAEKRVDREDIDQAHARLA